MPDLSHMATWRRIRETGDLSIAAAMRSFVRLGIADVLSDGPTSADEIAELLALRPDCVVRLLRAMSVAGFVDETHGGIVALAESGRMLCSSDPRSADAWLRCDDGHALLELDQSIRTGRPALDGIEGRSFFDRLRSDGVVVAHVGRDGEARARVELVGVADLDLWRDSTTVLVCGTGAGWLLASILASQPHLQGTFVDEADCTTSTAQVLQSLGRARRTGESGADVHLLARVLHRLDDDGALEVLASCRRAGAMTLLVCDHVLGDVLTLDQAISDLEMMALHGGRERTDSELASLLGAAGYGVVRRSELESGIFAVEAHALTGCAT